MSESADAARAKPWRVKYDGVCSRCGASLVRGSPAVWDRTSRTIHCIECPGASTAPPIADDTTPPIEVGVAGRSARAEHDRREARRDAAITERWGTGLVSKIVRAVSDEPQSTRAWAIGAAGEEKLARELDGVPGLLMLHDRRVPGTKGNIDHIVIAPAGVFVIDAKNHHGRLEIRDRGGFFRVDYRLYVGGRDCSGMADGMGWQVEAVREALADPEDRLPVVPVLCFLNAEWPLFRAPEEFRGVRLESHKSLKRILAGDTVIDDQRAAKIAARLSTRLPPK